MRLHTIDTVVAAIALQRARIAANTCTFVASNRAQCNGRSRHPGRSAAHCPANPPAQPPAHPPRRARAASYRRLRCMAKPARRRPASCTSRDPGPQPALPLGDRRPCAPWAAPAAVAARWPGHRVAGQRAPAASGAGDHCDPAGRCPCVPLRRQQRRRCTQLQRAHLDRGRRRRGRRCAGRVVRAAAGAGAGPGQRHAAPGRSVSRVVCRFHGPGWRRRADGPLAGSRRGVAGRAMDQPCQRAARRRAGRALFTRFLALLEAHYLQHWPVTRYAARLG